MMTASTPQRTAFALRVMVLGVITGALGIGSHLLAGGRIGNLPGVVIAGVAIVLISVIAARLHTAHFTWRLLTGVITGVVSQWATHTILTASERVAAFSAVTDHRGSAESAGHGTSSMVDHSHHMLGAPSIDAAFTGSFTTEHHSASPVMLAAHFLAAILIAWVLTDAERCLATLRSVVAAVYARVTVIAQGVPPTRPPQRVYTAQWAVLDAILAASQQRRGPPLQILHCV
ncbi:hypothetical protein [Jonesia quinghaiensis]|uniref:hypothetical protein n=1 Tax=Jonesia quinghaiensis TaxID=262806 RepID=UPI00040A2A7A|nr:hypothetical protein [Jonesia quinghaiensis]